jgi:hypothetical protein
MSTLIGFTLAHDVAGDYLAASSDGQFPSLAYAYWELAFIVFCTSAVSAFGCVIDMAKIEYGSAGIVVFATPFSGMIFAETVAETGWLEGAVGFTVGFATIMLLVDYWLQSKETESSRPKVGIENM